MTATSAARPGCAPQVAAARQRPHATRSSWRITRAWAATWAWPRRVARAGEIAVGRYDFAEAGRLLDEAIGLDPGPICWSGGPGSGCASGRRRGRRGGRHAHVRERATPTTRTSHRRRSPALVAYWSVTSTGRLWPRRARRSRPTRGPGLCLARRPGGPRRGRTRRGPADAGLRRPGQHGAVVQMWRGFCRHADEPALALPGRHRRALADAGRYPFAAIRPAHGAG